MDFVKRDCEHCLNCGVYYNKLYCTIYNNECKNISEKSDPMIYGPNECSEYTPIKNVTTCELSIEKAYKFITAGDSEFTLMSESTGSILDYRLTRVNSAGCIEIVAMARAKTLENKELSKYNSRVYLFDVYFKYINNDRYKLVGQIWFNRNQNKFESSTINNPEISNLLYVLNNLYSYKTRMKLYGKLRIFSHCKCGYCNQQLENIREFPTGLHIACTKHIRSPY